MANRVAARMGRGLARYLERRSRHYIAYGVTPPERLRAALAPGDVLLVEGDRHISAAIKYLTQSPWSHAAFCIGVSEGAELIEADLECGVRLVGLDDYRDLNTRICRPFGLAPEDLSAVIDHMRNSLGRTYDLKNLIDLARFLLPEPPVPQRFRRRMLAFGSGDPTRAICSTLIAEAFQSVRYPILPEVSYTGDGPAAREILHIRHHSLFTPRDFDLSPYFQVVKPTLARGFDYRAVEWGEDAPLPARLGRAAQP